MLTVLLGLLGGFALLLPGWAGYHVGHRHGRQDEHHAWLIGRCGRGRHA